MSGARLDAYYTPEWMVRILLDRLPIRGSVLEPCVGDGAIARHLQDIARVRTNDIDPAVESDFRLDARRPELWERGPWDWVITNPPFSYAEQIIPQAFEATEYGVAALLRLSWLEPTQGRRNFLAEHPPTQLIVMPRHKFDRASAGQDSVTTAWFVWEHGVYTHRIEVVPRKVPQEALL